MVIDLLSVTIALIALLVTFIYSWKSRHNSITITIKDLTHDGLKLELFNSGSDPISIIEFGINAEHQYYRLDAECNSELFLQPNKIIEALVKYQDLLYVNRCTRSDKPIWFYVKINKHYYFSIKIRGEKLKKITTAIGKIVESPDFEEMANNNHKYESYDLGTFNALYYRLSKYLRYKLRQLYKYSSKTMTIMKKCEVHSFIVDCPSNNRNDINSLVIIYHIDKNKEVISDDHESHNQIDLPNPKFYLATKYEVCINGKYVYELKEDPSFSDGDPILQKCKLIPQKKKMEVIVSNDKVDYINNCYPKDELICCIKKGKTYELTSYAPHFLNTQDEANQIIYFVSELGFTFKNHKSFLSTKKQQYVMCKKCDYEVRRSVSPIISEKMGHINSVEICCRDPKYVIKRYNNELHSMPGLKLNSYRSCNEKIAFDLIRQNCSGFCMPLIVKKYDDKHIVTEHVENVRTLKDIIFLGCFDSYKDKICDCILNIEKIPIEDYNEGLKSIPIQPDYFKKQCIDLYNKQIECSCNNYSKKLKEKFKKIVDSQEYMTTYEHAVEQYTQDGSFFINPDLNLGTFLISSQDSSITVCDYEFASTGPRSLELGFFLSHLVVSLLYDYGSRDNNSLKGNCMYVLDLFEKVMNDEECVCLREYYTLGLMCRVSEPYTSSFIKRCNDEKVVVEKKLYVLDIVCELLTNATMTIKETIVKLSQFNNL